MNASNREAVCQEIAADKRRLGLPLADVRRIDQYLREEWGVVMPPDENGWDVEFRRRAGEDLHRRYWTLHDRQANYLRRGKRIPEELETRFYNLIADRRISGWVHSQKRSFLLDAAALLVRVAKSLQVAGPILDVGCNIGYHAILLARETGCSVHGIDLSKPSLAVAKEKTPPDAQAKFDSTPLESDSLRGRFDMVYAVDSIILTLETLQAVTRPLADGGVAVLVPKLTAGAELEDWPAPRSAGLGFGFGDVIGGWNGPDRGFEAEPVIVLIKGGHTPPPAGLRQHTEAGWDYFKDYANTEGVPWEEKTQAFFRGKWIDAHPEPKAGV